MQSIQTLKNNSKGKKTLQSLMDGMPLTTWFSESLKDLQKQEEKAPWKMLFLDYEEDLCLLVQHSDPDLRYRVCSILVYSESKKCRRILWDQFEDSHQDIRILMIKLFQSSDRQKLYNTLFRLYIKDPVFRVRQEALFRIKKDFADLYTLYSENLNFIEKIHCLELLDVHSSHDHNLALRLMNDSHPGIILASSLYLEKSGTLDQLITKGRSRDLEDLNRRKKILSAAADHQVSSFLNKKENFSDKGSLFLAVEIFHRGVSSSNFSWIIAKVFDLKGESPFINNLKDKALSCLIKRKDPESILLLKQLLEQKLFRSYRMEYLLNSLPPEGSILFYPVLKKFLLDKDFPYWPNLIQSFVSIPLSLCLSDLYNLVRKHDADRIIRKRALLLLSRYGEFSSTLFILENLSLLDEEEMTYLGASILKSNKDQFLKIAASIFAEHDAPLHQNLMRLAAHGGIDDLIPVMEEKLSDADPESRITALSCLRELNHRGSLPKMTGLLYDPDKNVRSAAASIFVDWDMEETFSEIKNILFDKNESLSVQDAIIRGMSRSSNIRMISLLISLIDLRADLKDRIFQALRVKQSEEEICEIISFFESATESTRAFLNTLFKEMGEPVEESLMDLLGSTRDSQIKKSITTVLDSTGYVDIQIGILKSPFSSKRLTAAGNLSLIGTLKACRGLILAARDINRDIRILAIRGLVQIQENTEILETLKDDPDKKVRRYTLWAIERIKAARLP